MPGGIQRQRPKVQENQGIHGKRKPTKKRSKAALTHTHPPPAAAETNFATTPNSSSPEHLRHLLTGLDLHARFREQSKWNVCVCVFWLLVDLPRKLRGEGLDVLRELGVGQARQQLGIELHSPLVFSSVGEVEAALVGCKPGCAKGQGLREQKSQSIDHYSWN